MGVVAAARTNRSRVTRYLTIGLIGAGAAAAGAMALGGTSAQAAAPTFSATAGVGGHIQPMNNAAGQLHTFTITNTSTVGTIGSVRITRPSAHWTIQTCPMAPTTWTVVQTASDCTYNSPAGTGNNLQLAASSNKFQVKASTGTAATDQSGNWAVSVSTSDAYSIATAVNASPTDLSVVSKVWEVTNVVVVPSPANPGTPCLGGSKAAIGGSSQILAVCAKNNGSVAATPDGTSTLTGGYITSPGTFAGGSIPATSASVYVGSWSGAQITPTVGTGYSLTATIGAGASSTSQPALFWSFIATNANPDAVDDSATLTENAAPINILVRANDTDSNVGQTLTVSAIDTTGTVGIVTNNGTDVTYNSNGAFNNLLAGGTATDTFKYTISDGNGGTDQATVTVTITGLNDAPTANPDGTGVGEDGGNTTINVLANDTDPDTGDTKTVQTVNVSGTIGSVSFTANDVTYNPNGQFNYLKVGQTASDSFTYTMVDGSAASSTATVSVTIVGANDAPTAVNDTAAATEDGPSVNVNVLANDTDPDVGDTKTVTSVDTTGTNGTVTNNGSDVTYSTNGGFQGLGAGQTANTTFTYTMQDGSGASSTATVTVTVTGVNDAPDAVDNTGVNFTTAENNSFTTGNVLLNDTDPDLDVLSVTGMNTTGTIGTVTNNGNGTFGFDPGTNFDYLAVGQQTTTTFTYTIGDGHGGSDTATVTITINGSNDNPVAVNDSGFSTTEDATISIPKTSLLANDTDIDTGDVLSVTLANGASAGSVSLTATHVVYDPLSAFQSLQVGQTSSATFNYQIGDGHGGSSVAQVTVTIDGANDAPNAIADSAGANEDGPAVAVNLLSNDTDLDTGDTKTVQSVNTTGTIGAVTNNGSNVTYNPNGNFNFLALGSTATDTFSYTVVDSQGATSTATVTMTIAGQNDAPVAVADSASTNEDAVNVSINVLANDTDPDVGDTKTLQSLGALSNGGTASIVSNQVQFTPGSSFQDLQVGQSRVTSLTYQMSDNHAATSSALLTITVTGVNDAPVAVNDGTYAGVVGNTKATLSDGSVGPKVTLTGNLLNFNDTDPDAGDTKTASLVSNTAGATVTVNSDGSFIYIPPTSTQNTNDTFTYRVQDSQGAFSNNATVTLNIVERVWYVNNNLGVNGTGRSDSPFNVLSSAAAADDAGDYLFLQGGGANYAGGITLHDSEKLFGQPNGLSVTGAASSPIVSGSGVNAVITNATAAGSGITLANDNVIERVDVSNANTHGITGTSVTNLTIGTNTTISGSGGSEFRLTGNGTGTITVGSTITNGGTGIGVDIAGRTGGTTTLSGSVTSSGTTGVSVGSNSGGTININGTITTTAGTGVSAASNSGGNVNFTNSLNASGGAGINLNSNPNTVMTFTGPLTLSSGANAAFTAVGGGTVTNDSGDINTIVATTGAALNVTNTNIGAAGLTFRKIDAGTGSGSAGNGITVDNTGSAGGLTVTGTGTAGSGGTIQHKTGVDADIANGNGIFLRSTKNVSLAWMQLNDFDNMGIYGLSVDGFTFTNSKVSGTIGTSTGSQDSAVAFGKSNPSGLNGLVNGSTSTITDVDVSGAIEHNMEFYGQSSSFTLNITRANVHDNSLAGGSDGIQMELQGTYSGTVVVDDSDFTNNKSQAMQAAANDNSILNLTVKNSSAIRGSQGNEGFVFSNGSNGQLTLLVQGNTITGYGGVAIFAGQTAGNATASSNLNAKILSNTITAPTTATNHAIIAFLTSTVGQVAPAKLKIDGNTITQNSTTGVARGILVDTPDTNTTPTYNAVVTNNTVHIMDNVAGVGGIVVQGRRGPAGLTCAKVETNTVDFPNGNPGVNGIRVRQVSPATVNLETGSGSGTAAAVLATNNPLSTTEVLGTVGVVANGTCPGPP